MHSLKDVMKNSPIQIIYLNGPSSSGKTTLAKALQEVLEEPFLHIGIDKIIGWMPEKINDWTGGEAPLGYSWKKSMDTSTGNPIQELQVGAYAQKIEKTFQEVILALAKMGHRIVIDDVSFGKQQLDEWKTALKDLQVLWVGVNAPLAVLEQREKERGNRILGSARGQFYKVHVDTIYDLEIDTHEASISENIEKIMSLLHPSNFLESVAKKNASGLELKENEKDENLLIRPMRANDIAKLVSRYCFPWTTPEKTKTLWERYYQEQKDEVRTVAVIEKEGEILGYGSLLRKPESPFFAEKNIPEVNAIWIDEDHRRKGLGSALINWLENLASQEGYNEIGIGVGLYRDYGSAQQLYFQLGYIPDGKGITYKGQPTIPGHSYPLDDDLILWLMKTLVKRPTDCSLMS